MKKQGSAILIAILLVTAIGALAFSFGKILLYDIANAGIYENGVGSYYSAESGVEEGMLRYRDNQMTEVPSQSFSLSSKIGANGKVFRSDLTNKIIQTSDTNTPNDYSGMSKTTLVSSNVNQYYDLRMGYVGSSDNQPFWGNDLDSPSGLDLNDLGDSNYGSTTPSLNVGQDQVIKFTIPPSLNLSSNDLLLFAAFPGIADINKAILKVSAVVENPTLLTPTQYEEMIAYNPDGAALPGNLGGSSSDYARPTFTTFVGGAASMPALSVSGLLTQLLGSPPQLNSTIELSIRPLYNNARIGLTTTNCQTFNSSIGYNSSCDGTDSTVLPGPITKIISSGYYMGSVKTLESDIDRQSGTTYDLFDYVIYNGSAN